MPTPTKTVGASHDHAEPFAEDRRRIHCGDGQRVGRPVHAVDAACGMCAVCHPVLPPHARLQRARSPVWGIPAGLKRLHRTTTVAPGRATPWSYVCAVSSRDL